MPIFQNYNRSPIGCSNVARRGTVHATELQLLQENAPDGIDVYDAVLVRGASQSNW